jgi:hypothetical protein
VERSAERAAANEARFREANEQIDEKVHELGSLDRSAPYLCECEEELCTTIVLLTAAEYEGVRSRSRRFVVRHDGFTVIEKTGEEGRIVEELDPRREV